MKEKENKNLLIEIESLLERINTAKKLEHLTELVYLKEEMRYKLFTLSRQGSNRPMELKYDFYSASYIIGVKWPTLLGYETGW